MITRHVAQPTKKRWHNTERQFVRVNGQVIKHLLLDCARNPYFWVLVDIMHFQPYDDTFWYDMLHWGSENFEKQPVVLFQNHYSAILFCSDEDALLFKLKFSGRYTASMSQ